MTIIRRGQGLAADLELHSHNFGCSSRREVKMLHVSLTPYFIGQRLPVPYTEVFLEWEHGNGRLEQTWKFSHWEHKLQTVMSHRTQKRLLTVKTFTGGQEPSLTRIRARPAKNLWRMHLDAPHLWLISS